MKLFVFTHTHTCLIPGEGAAPIAGLTLEETQRMMSSHELMKARLIHEGKQRKQLIDHLEQVKQMRAKLNETVEGQEQVLRDLQVRVSLDREEGQHDEGSSCVVCIHWKSSLSALCVMTVSHVMNALSFGCRPP